MHILDKRTRSCSNKTDYTLVIFIFYSYYIFIVSVADIYFVHSQLKSSGKGIEV